MQVQGADSLLPKSSRYSSPLDCAVKTVFTEGVSGIFRGGLRTLVRESIGNVVFFSVYEYVRYHMHSRVKAEPNQPKQQLLDIGFGDHHGWSWRCGILVCEESAVAVGKDISQQRLELDLPNGTLAVPLMIHQNCLGMDGPEGKRLKLLWTNSCR